MSRGMNFRKIPKILPAGALLLYQQFAKCTRQAGFSDLQFTQSIIRLPGKALNFDQILDNYGGGVFVAYGLGYSKQVDNFREDRENDLW